MTGASLNWKPSNGSHSICTIGHNLGPETAEEFQPKERFRFENLRSRPAESRCPDSLPENFAESLSIQCKLQNVTKELTEKGGGYILPYDYIPDDYSLVGTATHAPSWLPETMHASQTTCVCSAIAGQ